MFILITRQDLSWQCVILAKLYQRFNQQLTLTQPENSHTLRVVVHDCCIMLINQSTSVPHIEVNPSCMWHFTLSVKTMLFYEDRGVIKLFVL